ncbi:MAG: right-handed parallel beta-helix repeat-containing protein [Segetibacter sp.]|nr:right-handed parallel beta-helix repeat-containing protein [Segetibacter sp.]
MKRSIFTLFVLTLLVIMQTNAFATIRRVGFTQSLSPVNGLDYTSFQAAHDAAVNGDTIQLYPTNGGSGYNQYNGSIIKRLIILGPGYYYNNNTLTTPGGSIPNGGLQLLPGSIYSNNFTIGVGSAGTIFQGINYLGVTTSNTLDSLNDILISRCRNVSVSFNNSGVCNNWIISQCYNASVSQSGFGISFSANRTITNLRIENTVGPSISFSASGPQSPVGVNSGQVLNCLFGSGTTGIEGAGGGLNLNNSTFVVQNCIDIVGNLAYPYSNGLSNTIFVNNLTNLSPVNNPVSTNPGSSGNVFNINPAGNAIFVGYPTNVSGGQVLYSSDGAWQLSATSPAKNAGIIPGTNTPTDCGIFGGLNPYKASGIPAVPSFYKLSSPSSTATTNPYIMTFSVRSNN